MTTVMSKLKRLLVILVTLYGVLLAGLCLAERSILYHPDPTRTAPAAAGLPQAEEITLRTADGEALLAWYVAPRPDKTLVIYFHGKARSGGGIAVDCGACSQNIPDRAGRVADEGSISF